MRMHNPPHPGEIIKALCLEPLGLTITHAAEALGVSRKTLSAILNGRAGITPEMAVSLSIAFTQIPHGRYINFMSDFLASEKGATREQAIQAWKHLKSLDCPKTYRAWVKSQSLKPR